MKTTFIKLIEGLGLSWNTPAGAFADLLDTRLGRLGLVLVEDEDGKLRILERQEEEQVLWLSIEDSKGKEISRRRVRVEMEWVPKVGWKNTERVTLEIEPMSLTTYELGRLRFNAKERDE